MARIEYLIQHPNEVEFTDLELLNTEIEKYPYFYSLRALKLLALKKGNDSNFDQELKVASVYSPNRKHLYNFIHQEGKLEEEPIIEEIDNNPISENENSVDVIDETSEDNINSVDNGNSLIDIQEEETEVFEDINELTSEVDENEIVNNNVFSEEINEENTTDTEEELSRVEETAEQSDETSSEDVELELIEDKNTPIEIVDDSIVKEEIILVNSIDEDESTDIVDNSSEIKENSIQGEESIIKNSEEISLVEIVDNSKDSGEFTINEPTIESIIEEFKQQDFTSPEVDNSLIDFDLPSVNEKVNIDQSVEHSIEVAKLFIENEVESIPSETIAETVIEVDEPKIEQVSLVNRAPIQAEEKNSIEQQIAVSSLNPFQIQNIKNEVIGGFKQEKLREITVDEELTPTQEIINNIDESTQISENVQIQNVEEITSEVSDTISSIDSIKTDIKESNPVEEIKKTISSKEDSLSFNDWLKLKQDHTEVTPEKEIKYQIIDEFLEKNPKITPIKKQEIPESKNQIKELKQTDFSDLMTETLAQIYIEQKQYEKAIRAYKILSLKYPEKNSLFAKQIKEIEILKNSK